MKPPSASSLEQENAALRAEQAGLQRKLRELENKNAALKVRQAELERLAQAAAAGAHQATDPEGAPPAKGQSDPGNIDPK
jgi:peptidoglycan hydrolase CwlO-like protein